MQRYVQLTKLLFTMLLVVVTVNTSIILSAFGTIVPNLGSHLDGARLNVPITIGHWKKHEQCANSFGNVYLTPTYDSACNLASSGASCGVNELHFSG